MADQWSLYVHRSIEEMSTELEKNVGNRTPCTLSHCFEQYPALFVSPIRAFQLHIARILRGDNRGLTVRAALNQITS
jgi:hypothetical protein